VELVDLYFEQANVFSARIAYQPASERRRDRRAMRARGGRAVAPGGKKATHVTSVA
jgi:hypothetical protein